MEVWVELCSSERYVQALNTGICECDLIWKWGLCRYNQIKMRSYWIRVSSKFNATCVLIRRGKFGHTDIEAERHVMTDTRLE